MGTVGVLVLPLLILLSFSSHAVEVFHSHYKKILVTSDQWPTYFFDSIPLQPSQTGCGVICSTYCQLNSLGCGVYLLRNNTCYLGSVTNNLGSVFSFGQTENEAVYINPKRVGDLSVKFNYLGGVKSYLEWFSTTNSYIDLPPGSVVNDCLYHCLYEELNCDVAVFENGRCHFGEWNTTAQSSVANLKNTTGPWNVYFNGKYADYYTKKYAWMRALNTTLGKVSNHTFMKLTTNLEIVCLMGCNFHAQHSQPCTFYVFINATNECYLGDIGTSGLVKIVNKNNSVLVTSLRDQETVVGNHFSLTIPVKGYHINGFLYKRTNSLVCGLNCYLDPDGRCSFYFISSGFCYLGDVLNAETSIPPPKISPSANISIFINADYTRTSNVSARSYTQVVMPYKTSHHRFIHQWGGFPTLEDCATACHAGFKRSSRDALDMKCQFFFYNATSLNCYVGNLEFKSEGPPSDNDGIITLFIQTAILEEVRNGEDFSHASYRPSWNSFIYREAVVSGASSLQCGALCIFDTGPCNIAITNRANGACYLGDWYINSTEFDQITFVGLVSHRKPQLGVILGGLDHSLKMLDTVDVIDEFRTSCENPAIPTLPVPLYGHAGFYSESDNEIVVCGGHQNTSNPNFCFKSKLDNDIPSWSLISSRMEHVSRFQLVPTESGFFSIGGDRATGPISNIYRTSQIGKKWVTDKLLPEPTQGHCSVVHAGQIWIIGGKSTDGAMLKRTTIYDPVTHSFRTPGTTGNLNLARYLPLCGLIKDPETNHDWILVIGGIYDVSNKSLKVYSRSSILRSVEYFDIQEDSQWRVLPTHVPFYESNVTLPFRGASSGGMIKFGPSRYLLFLGWTINPRASANNLAMWNRDIGQFNRVVSTSMQSGRNLGAVVQIPLHTRWTCLPMGNEWVKMVEQNRDHFFQPLELVGYPNTQETIISNLDTLDQYKSCNDFYHLRLVWPELGYFNEWRQKSNFIDHGPVLDYQAIAVRYPNFFKGLIHVNGNEKPDGYPDHTYFKGDTRSSGQYAVGRYSNGPDGRIPGPVGNRGSGDIPISVDKIILYVKKDC